jgi:hypothetical protein
MGPADSVVLGKTNTAMRIEVTGLNLALGCFYEPTEPFSLLFRDRRSQVLNLGCMLPHEDDECYFRNPADPGMTHKLRIKRKQTTLNFYTHAIPETHRRAIESLEEALFPDVPKCSQVGDSGKKTKVVIH